MNLTAFLRRLGPLLLAAVSVVSLSLLTSCGSTIYGMGVDLERIGNRMQGSGRPTSGYQAPSQGAYQQPSSGGNWSYYQ